VLGAELFNLPEGVSSDGTHVWVANEGIGNERGSVTELNVATGAKVRRLPGYRYGFNRPVAVSSDGTNVWVANRSGNSVTEIDESTGAPVRVLSDPGYPFDHPAAVSSDGTDVWVTNALDSTLIGFPTG
jgi:DNA-binding beta-propeller fold protein YncE